jgi:hypothetical protein
VRVSVKSFVGCRNPGGASPAPTKSKDGGATLAGAQIPRKTYLVAGAAAEFADDVADKAFGVAEEH